MSDIYRLDYLVDLVDDKTNLVKNPSLPYIGLENIAPRGAGMRINSDTATSISINSIFQAGDVLFGKLRPNLRKCAPAPFAGYCSTDILVLRPRTNISPAFAAKVFQTELVGAEAEKTAAGTKMPRTSWGQLRALEVFCPELASQELIAKVLDTLDTTIRQTEAIIEKLKQVKQGLLHDLLTRGIDANGELRPPQSEAPELYKETALGWIPMEWLPTQLGKLAKLQRGHDIVESSFITGPYEVISSSGTIGYHNKATSRGPNVVVGRKGSIGLVHFIESDFWAHDTSLFVTNFFGNDEKFVFHLFTHLRLAQFGTKSGSPSLNRNDIHPLPVGVPNIKEQKFITKILDNHDNLALKITDDLKKMAAMKAGLMDDLLTGRVRVTPLLESATA